MTRGPSTALDCQDDFRRLVADLDGGRAVPGESDAADEQVRAVVERSAGVSEAGNLKHVRSPGRLGRCGHRGDERLAAGRGDPTGGTPRDVHRTQARSAEEGAGLHGGEARRSARRPCEREVEAHAAARGAAALSAQANLVLLIEEGEVVRPQPVVAEESARMMSESASQSTSKSTKAVASSRRPRTSLSRRWASTAPPVGRDEASACRTDDG